MTGKTMARIRALYLIHKFKKGYVPELDTSTTRKKEQSIHEIVLYGLYKQFPKKSKVLAIIYSKIKIEVL